MAKRASRTVQVNILAMQFVVTAPIIIQSLIEKYSFSKLLFGIGFILTALNFFHGKISALDDEFYNKIINLYPKKGLADFFLNTISVLLFIFIAVTFSLENFNLFIIVNIILRLIDTMLVLLVRTISFDETTRRAQIVWLYINLVFIIIFSLILIKFKPLETHLFTISIFYIAYSVLDILLDYTLNRNLYFESNRSWDALANFWDSLQGEYGDIYRREIINPKLDIFFKEIKNKSVLDLGCGNGSLSRFFAKKGGKVVGVDKFESMLKIAKSHIKENIIYKQYDMNNSDSIILNGNFDIIIASFSFQDCTNLSYPFKTLKKNLSSTGKAIIIFENKNSFESEKLSSELTKRMWLNSSKKNGKGRKQLIIWEAKAILKSQGIEAYNKFIETNDQHTFSTVTRYWSKEKHFEEALINDLKIVKFGDFSEKYSSKINSTLLKYNENPKFSFIILEN